MYSSYPEIQCEYLLEALRKRFGIMFDEDMYITDLLHDLLSG